MPYQDPRARQPGQQQPGSSAAPNATASDPRGTNGTKAGGQPGASNGVPAWSGPMPSTYTPPGQTPPLPPGTVPSYVGAFSGNVPLPTGQGPMAFGVQGQHFNPTNAPYGFDMTQPGQGEQFWNNNQQLWLDSPSLDWVDSNLKNFDEPWQGEQFVSDMLSSIGGKGAGQQYWNGVGGNSNTYQGPNNAQTAFDMTKSQMPGSLQPKFDAYYDRMKDKVMSDVNSQSAARGVYGSNSALNNSIGAGLDIEAQRAKAATDFAFEDSANQRAWADSLSGQGRSADLSGTDAFRANLDAQKFDVDKFSTLGDLAFGLDDSKASRLGAGVSTAFGSDDRHRGRLSDAFSGANTAQDQREERINKLYGQTSDFSNDTVDFLSDYYDQILGGDGAMSDQELQTLIAQTADQRGWDEQTRERIFRDAKAVIDAKNGKTNADEAGAVK